MRTTIDLPDEVRLKILAHLMKTKKSTRGLSTFLAEAALEKLARETPNDLTSAKPQV